MDFWYLLPILALLAAVFSPGDKPDTQRPHWDPPDANDAEFLRIAQERAAHQLDDDDE